MLQVFILKEYNEKVVAGTESLISNYEKGLFEIKLVPMEGQYVYKVYDKNSGSELLEGYNKPTSTSVLDKNVIVDLLDTPKYQVDNVMIDFIKQYQEHLRKITRNQ